MINAKDVRLGNLIHGTDGTIKEVTTDAILYLERYTGINQATGISLSEDWLLKFGFKKSTAGEGGENYVEYYEISNLVVCNWGDGFIMSNSFSHGIRISLKYVHQLQNLYFAITEKELELSSVESA